MVIAKEATVGRKRRGVNGFEHEMLAAIDERCLALSITAPEDEHEVLALVAQRLDHSIGECLPPSLLMRTCLVCSHGECGIEEEYALLCPACEIACGRYWFAKIVVYLYEDVAQRRWEWHAVIDREAQSMCLSWFVIRILTYNNHLYLA